MEIILHDYHKKVTAEKKATVEYWKTHQIHREAALSRLKLLREQRLANLEKRQNDL